MNYVKPLLRRLRSENINSRTLLRGATNSFAINILATLVGLILDLFLARVLGASEYGEFIYVFTWVVLLSILGQFGQDLATVRFIGNYIGSERWDLFRGFLQRSTQFVLAISFGISVVVILIVVLGQDQLGVSRSNLFLVGVWILPLTSFFVLISARLRAMKHVFMAQFPHDVLIPILVIAGILLGQLLGIEPNALRVMAVTLIATAIAFLLPWRAYRQTSRKYAQAVAQYANRAWLSTSFQLMLYALLTSLVVQINIIMLGSLADTTEAGIYSVASKGASLVQFGLIAVNFVIAPLIAELYVQNKRSELIRVIRLGNWSILGVSVPASLVLIVGGPFLLRFFGAEFSEGYPALVIVAIGQLLNAATGPVGIILIMTGHQRYVTVALALTGCVSVAANFLLIPTLGIEGAALARGGSLVLLNVGLAIITWRLLKIDATVLSLFRRTPKADEAN